METVGRPTVIMAKTIKGFGMVDSSIKDEPITEEAFKTYTGHYKFEKIPLEADVFWKDGKPHVQGTNQPAFTLLYQGAGEFRANFDTDVKIVFADDGKSFVLHQGRGEVVAKRVE